MRFLFTLFFAWIAIPTASFGSDFQSPRTLSLGGAGHAGPLLNDPIYLNPAFASLNQTYALGFSYLKFAGDSAYGRNWNLSILDGHNEYAQAGMGYTVREDGSLVHLALSKQIQPWLSGGIGGKFFFTKDHKVARDMTLGFAGLPTPWLQVALVVDNIIGSPEARRRGLNREVTLGSKFNIMGITLAYLDPHLSMTGPSNDRFGHEAGLEFPLMQDFFFRLGQFRNSGVFYQGGARGNGWSTGAGWVAPRISLDYAYSRLTSSKNGLTRSITHNFGATIFF